MRKLRHHNQSPIFSPRGLVFSRGPLLGGAAAVFESLLENGDFETGALAPWTDASTGTGTATVNGSNQLELVRIDSSNQGQAQQILLDFPAGDYVLSWDAVSGTASRSSISGIGLREDNPRSFTWPGGNLTLVYNVNGNGTSVIDNIVLAAA